MPWRGPEYPGEFATLGHAILELGESVCVIPDGDRRGQPMLLTDEQARFVLWYYRINPKTGRFYYARGGQLVRPQKWGKDPFAAWLICVHCHPEAPVVPDGWDSNGEPVGKPWPTPWVQVTGVSEDATDNTWLALQPMIELGPLADLWPDTGITRINLHNGGLIEPVTSAADSRFGQRVTFPMQGEALALDTPLPTPTGWVTMGDVRVGDQLIGSDGRATLVVKTTRVQDNRKCYRVTFVDGTSLVASDGHLWQTRVSGSAAKPRVRSTEEMVIDGRGFRVPRTAPMKTPDVPLPVDPYLLGLWLGDGSCGQGYITAARDDAEFYIEQIKRAGEYARYREGHGHRVGAVALGWPRGPRPDPPSVRQRIRQLGIFYEKAIPAVYLRASIDQRVALVQGLMDTDGSVSERGHCEYSGAGRLLIDGVAELLRSLGQVAAVTWRADDRARSGGCFKVHFTPHGIQPFRLPRKVERVRSSLRAGRGPEWVTIKSIEPVPGVPVRCVAVASDDHLFVAGEGFHLTHNTHLCNKHNGMRRVIDTQRRNTAGIGGRFLEITNSWDPNEDSVAKDTNTEHGVYVDDVEPGPGSVRNRRERHRMYRIVYGDSWRRHKPEAGRVVNGWVDLDRIDDEALALLPRDPSQVERFYLNRKQAGEGTAFDIAKWAGAVDSKIVVPDRALVVLGADGPRFSDSYAVVATEVATGHQWPVGIWEAPEKPDPLYEHSWDEINGAVAEAFERFTVWRAYVNPTWEGPLDTWRGAYGDKVVLPWLTNRPRAMAYAVRNYVEAIVAGDLTNDGESTMARHIAAARKHLVNVYDEKRVQMYTIGHEPGGLVNGARAGCLSWEARGDAIAKGALNETPPPATAAAEGGEGEDIFARRGRHDRLNV